VSYRCVPFLRASVEALNVLCPANLPDDSIIPISTVAKTGVYYGYAQVLPPLHRRSEFNQEDLEVLPMVMSLGWNPFYKNKQLTAVSRASLAPTNFF